ncbi:MAG TPA: FAD-dependent oxidoreductase [Polyangiaceae bacterium]|nr:FAD-dependent oxidoreductase [Polyangiaceae bacterium]
MKIAVVGAGVTGLVAAYRLGRTHDVRLFESEARLGGHANTVEVRDHGRTLALDTGFLVFNAQTYPNFVGLLAELGVPSAPSRMSFSVRSEARDFEYAGTSLDTLYAQRRHLASPGFHRMVWDILRFYREAPALLDAERDVPLRSWLEERRFSRQFSDDHLLPMLRAVWSARSDVAEDFPARFLVRFFKNHGFLSVDQPPWLTIPGGSQSYVEAIERRLRAVVRRGARVERVIRHGSGISVATAAGSEHFDHVVLACHADQALALVAEPSALERELLSAFPYQPNVAVLHCDERLMPRRRRVWSSWNVHLDDEGVDGACITYWLNSLQSLPTTKNYFVTLNRSHAIDPAKVLARFDYAHPVFTLASVAAQARHDELIDHRGISYAGAYFRNGFHEDGVVSALRVCERLASSAMGTAA